MDFSWLPSSPYTIRSGLWWKIHWIFTSGYWSTPPRSLRNLLTRGSRLSRQALHETTLPVLYPAAQCNASRESASAPRRTMRAGASHHRVRGGEAFQRTTQGNSSTAYAYTDCSYSAHVLESLTD